MSANPVIPASQENAPGTWTEIPRQPVQRACHNANCKRRTFYWTLEVVNGKAEPVCDKCVSFRAMEETRASSVIAVAVVKKRKSNKSPSEKAAVIARRVQGETKTKIAADLHMAHNTVTTILEEADLDEQILAGRASCVSLIPEAVTAVQYGLRKGDGNLGVRFLEGVGVIGDDRQRRPSSGVDAQLFVSIQNLIQPPKPAEAPKDSPINAEVIDQPES
jgi:hypothetical protein